MPPQPCPELPFTATHARARYYQFTLTSSGTMLEFRFLAEFLFTKINKDLATRHDYNLAQPTYNLLKFTIFKFCNKFSVNVCISVSRKYSNHVITRDLTCDKLQLFRRGNNLLFTILVERLYRIYGSCRPLGIYISRDKILRTCTKIYKNN